FVEEDTHGQRLTTAQPYVWRSLVMSRWRRSPRRLSVAARSRSGNRRRSSARRSRITSTASLAKTCLRYEPRDGSVRETMRSKRATDYPLRDLVHIVTAGKAERRDAARSFPARRIESALAMLLRLDAVHFFRKFG